MKIAITISIIILIFLVLMYIPIWPKRVKLGVIKVNTFEKIKLMRGILYMDKKSSADDEQSKAIQIAEDKIKQKFPNMIRNGEILLLERVSPVKDRPHVWFLQYNIQKHLDSGIFIMVNVETGEVIEYQDEWA